MREEHGIQSILLLVHREEHVIQSILLLVHREEHVIQSILLPVHREEHVIQSILLPVHREECDFLDNKQKFMLTDFEACSVIFYSKCYGYIIWTVLN